MTSKVSGEYLFNVQFRVSPSDSAVSLSPETFETTMAKRAPPPGEDGWLFFRDNLWRGEANNEAHLRDLASETLGVTVESVSFIELRCTGAYFAQLKADIRSDLTPFRADSASEVIKKYLGSSVRVT